MSENERGKAKITTNCENMHVHAEIKHCWVKMAENGRKWTNMAESGLNMAKQANMVGFPLQMTVHDCKLSVNDCK